MAIKDKLKKMGTDLRILLMVFCLALALVMINPKIGHEGVTIRSIEMNSSAYLAGMEPPKPNEPPVSRERILEVNNQKVLTVDDYERLTAALPINSTVSIRTSKNQYRLRTQEAFDLIFLNETMMVTTQELIYSNDTLENGSIQERAMFTNITREVQKMERVSKGTAGLGISVYQAPQSNLRKGLDLQGGTRVLLQPEALLSPEDMASLIETMTQRLNVYGLSDLVVREAGDLSGNQYILVEVAGASEGEIRELLARQGKFEAKIAGTTVFRGGDDVTFVCRSANCAGIDPNRGCFRDSGANICAFSFSITLSREAAEKQAQITSTLPIISEGANSYLSEPLELYLDDNKVDELSIGADLKGEATTNIQISGSGTGQSQDAAAYNSLQNMKRLQTILITGSLPVKLNVVKADAISPVLGANFVKNSLLIALVAMILVSVIIAIRYKTAALSGLIISTMATELIMVFGLASFIGWNIDLAAIAGIIAAIGTGVHDQIVIADEAIKGGTSESSFNWKERIKRAFMIILLAYVTIMVAMIPLVFAGAGLLKGFAITTILGVSVGVFITRPAFSRMLEIVLK